MRWQAIRQGAVIVAGIGALAAVMVGLEQLMPPVVPTAHAAATGHPAPALKPVRTSVPPAVPKPNAEGLVPISYGPSLSAIAHIAQQLHLKIWLPRQGVSPVTFQESYRDGTQVDLLYSNMIIMESSQTIPSTYRPLVTTPTSLANGTSGQWEWIPGVGGPSHRLMFQLQQTRVRLEMEDGAPLHSAVAVANSFVPLSALG
ncbi:hypothetical protein [Sulfobacillus harzensis]|uniref:Uncharacterized protein n=1 Tax=Sulfobacillus harzensis TaxID=2729629 RepID=A0A7Y0L0U6_9FIRM|nr:hypothetical protein [Sulfobacillus harzensis]NMP20902.1 hypothetical protein [Sulfobacillus harzensis]